MAALAQLEAAYDAAPPRPALLVGAARAARPLRRPAHAALPRRPARVRGARAGDRRRRARRRLPHRLRLYLKREDLAHTGAHKINNALGQALLTRRLGKTRVIAETGAGQHGVATATACALLGLPCVVYMGAEDIERQQPNVLRMRALGAEVRPVTRGSATLKDAINEAMRDWVTNVETTHYVLGSAMGPHPYPTIVRDLQRRIGDEAAAQVVAVEGRLPDLVLACVGGGSNAIGLLDRFIGEPSVRLAVAEAAGDGIETGRHAAALAGGTPGILHGARSMMLQDRDGQVVEAHSASAGLDYPGVGPQIAALAAAGRLELAGRDRRRGVRGDALAGPDRGDPAGARDRPRPRGPAAAPRRDRGQRAATGPRRRSSWSGCPGAATRTSRRSGGGSRRTGRDGGRRRPPPRRPAGTNDTAGARRIAAAFAAAARRRPGRADPVRRRRLSRRGHQLSRRRSPRSTPAPTSSSSACRTRTRSPTARRSSARRRSRFANGATLEGSLRLIERIAAARPDIPIVPMGYANQFIGGGDGTRGGPAAGRAPARPASSSPT